MVEELINQVNSANPSKIKLFIDSWGGNANIGISVYNFLKNFNAKIEVEIIGACGSISTVIAMAANKGKLKIARNGWFVPHRAWGSAEGNSEDLRQTADVIDMYTAQIVDIYTQRTGKAADEINGLIANGDYWMTGKQAVEQGWCDEALNDNADFQIAASIQTVPSDYKNVPKEMLHNEPNTILNLIKTELMDIVNDIKNSFAGLKADNKFKGVQAHVDLIGAVENAITPQFEAIQNKLQELEDRKPEAPVFNIAENTEFKALNDAHAQVTADLKTANETIATIQADMEKMVSGKSDGKKEDIKNTIATTWH